MKEDNRYHFSFCEAEDIGYKINEYDYLYNLQLEKYNEIIRLLALYSYQSNDHLYFNLKYDFNTDNLYEDDRVGNVLVYDIPEKQLSKAMECKNYCWLYTDLNIDIRDKLRRKEVGSASLYSIFNYLLNSDFFPAYTAVINNKYLLFEEQILNVLDYPITDSSISCKFRSVEQISSYNFKHSVYKINVKEDDHIKKFKKIINKENPSYIVIESSDLLSKCEKEYKDLIKFFIKRTENGKPANVEFIVKNKKLEKLGNEIMDLCFEENEETKKKTFTIDLEPKPVSKTDFKEYKDIIKKLKSEEDNWLSIGYYPIREDNIYCIQTFKKLDGSGYHVELVYYPDRDKDDFRLFAFDATDVKDTIYAFYYTCVEYKTPIVVKKTKKGFRAKSSDDFKLDVKWKDVTDTSVYIDNMTDYQDTILSHPLSEKTLYVYEYLPDKVINGKYDWSEANSIYHASFDSNDRRFDDYLGEKTFELYGGYPPADCWLLSKRKLLKCIDTFPDQFCNIDKGKLTKNQYIIIKCYWD